ncbi:ankyrin repeat-containing domain protein [Mariannaea sp. PMI_226]|nr:ankyrin repeat-containing domain protein [Mariannaea sp. PMI_226]
MAVLPQLPAPLTGLVKYISDQPEESVIELLKPYRQYEAELRSVFAQHPQDPILADHHVNVLPLFTQHTQLVTTRARNLGAESEDEKSKYIMTLPDDKRRAHGSPAIVADLAEFQKNFSVFSESSLAELDWSNVVAAGSSVVNCLLPVPEAFKTTKRKLREYYHEKFCPASDVDLFLYGLTQDQAIERIKQIEQAIRDALLNEVTVVRTKHAITIVSQYPVRHVQIVLRVYKSVSEILTGFDIDAAGGAYDGKQVYVTPRALGSFITQINQIDLTRRSPSYENRLSKYSHRNFEIYWPELDRSRIDPTIFERAFRRTLGLARLLILERLPTNTARETYLKKRREERGRPALQRDDYTIPGNIKDIYDDEVADWVSEEDVSNYNTFTIPYGKNFNAKRIEKLCYTRDLLLNAEWNKPDDREVNLHRHPAFFGRVEDVVEDCCGWCPKPVTEEEIEIAEKEAQTYISGKVVFLTDDPGRQQIGSFNPLTDGDWTDMAYVGNTAKLCQSIVDGDVDDVLDWLKQEDSDPNKRDHTGRSPLHLAVMVSTPEVVKSLVDHGARLIARLADGKTTLHLAAARGDIEIIKILMAKSVENKEAEEKAEEQRRKDKPDDHDMKNGEEESRAQGSSQEQPDEDSDEEMDEESNESMDDESDEEMDDESDENMDSESEGELVDGEMSEPDDGSMVTGSFVKVKQQGADGENGVPEDNTDEPDFFDINALAWDVPSSPLHLAIAEGNEDAVKLLCEYGADFTLPIKFSPKKHEVVSNVSRSMLTLSLALSLPLEKAKSMAQLLLKLGAKSSQGDADGCTPLHKYVESGNSELVDTLWDSDPAGFKAALNHMAIVNGYWDPDAIGPIHIAAFLGDTELTLKLLDRGASPAVDFDTWLKAAKVSPVLGKYLGDLEKNFKLFKRSTEQPLITAIRRGAPDVALQLLDRGADPNTGPGPVQGIIADESGRPYTKGELALDLVQDFISRLSKYPNDRDEMAKIPRPLMTSGLDTFMEQFNPGTYSHWVVSNDIDKEKKAFKDHSDAFERNLKREESLKGVADKKLAISELISGYQALEKAIIAKGGETFAKRHPDLETGSQVYVWKNPTPSKEKIYAYNFAFKGDKELTTTRKDGYIQLMEAAWANDIEKIKSLTLQAWGPEKDQPPLKAAIDDGNSNTPFSIAFLRGHHQAAWTLLEIIKAQWSAPEQKKVHYKIQHHQDDEDDEDSALDSDGSDRDRDENEPRIVSEKIDHQFTVENIGHVSMSVKSHVLPLDAILQPVVTFKCSGDQSVDLSEPKSLFTHVMDVDDNAGLKALLEMVHHFADEKQDDDKSSAVFSFPMSVFHWAVEKGKTHQLSMIIKHTGAGIPLDSLVKKSGVKMNKKPRYYQGLSVYGKKRDWAAAGRGVGEKATGPKTPPLLHAALGGSIDSVEFFLGDTPHRLYAEFGNSTAAQRDTRLKHLNNTSGGFDRTISRWLAEDNDLVIHCAVLATPSEAANTLLKYLVKAAPGAIEKKNANGDTPLLVACRLGRVDYVKILIGGNANLLARNLKGENILHAALYHQPLVHQLRPLLDLLDADLVRYLFLQRKNLNHFGNTPLHAWLAKASGFQEPVVFREFYYSYNQLQCTKPYSTETDAVNMLKLLLEYSKGEELEMLDGAGDTCLHTTVGYDMFSLARVLIEFQPRLLYRENAVGRTPVEIAHDRFTASNQFAQPQRISLGGNLKGPDIAVCTKPEVYALRASLKGKTQEEKVEMLARVGLSGSYSDEETFQIISCAGIGQDYEDKKPGEERIKDETSKKVMWDLCLTATKKNHLSRRLASLHEANDVASRIGEEYAASRYFSIESKEESNGESSEGEEEEQRKTKKEKPTDFSTTELEMRSSTAWKSGEELSEEKELQIPGYFHRDYVAYCTMCETHHV